MLLPPHRTHNYTTPYLERALLSLAGADSFNRLFPNDLEPLKSQGQRSCASASQRRAFCDTSKVQPVDFAGMVVHLST
jgi:hypothetical protein